MAFEIEAGWRYSCNYREFTVLGICGVIVRLIDTRGAAEIETVSDFFEEYRLIEKAPLSDHHRAEGIFAFKKMYSLTCPQKTRPDFYQIIEYAMGVRNHLPPDNKEIGMRTILVDWERINCLFSTPHMIVTLNGETTVIENHTDHDLALARLSGAKVMLWRGRNSSEK